MKFSIALGFLLANFVSSKLSETQKVQIDNFLRENQNLEENVKLVSINDNGQFSEVTYHRGPEILKFDVKQAENSFKIIGTQQIISIHNNVPIMTQQPMNPSITIEAFKPLPLIMPHFEVNDNNGNIQMRNVFEEAQSQMSRMHEIMQKHRTQMQKIRNLRKAEMQERFQNNMERNEQLIGGPHDYNQFTDLKLIGGGDHDMWQEAEESWQQQLQNMPLIGGGDHDNWEDNIAKAILDQFGQPLIGGGDHDNWRKHRKEERKKHREDRKRRHPHRGNWKQHRQFTTQQILPYLQAKLPDFTVDSEIISITNNGFKKRRGFSLDIKLKDKNQQTYEVEALFKPFKQEFLIDSIKKDQSNESFLELGKKLIEDVLGTLRSENLPIEESKQSKQIKTAEEIIPPSFIPQQPLPLLGGQDDPDHDPQFMKVVGEWEQQSQSSINNHIPTPVQEKEQSQNIPLLGGQTDPDNVHTQNENVPEINIDPEQKQNIQNLVEGMLEMINEAEEKQQKSAGQVKDINEVKDTDISIQKVQEDIQESEIKAEDKEKMQLLVK